MKIPENSKRQLNLNMNFVISLSHLRSAICQQKPECRIPNSHSNLNADVYHQVSKRAHEQEEIDHAGTGGGYSNPTRLPRSGEFGHTDETAGSAPKTKRSCCGSD